MFGHHSSYAQALEQALAEPVGVPSSLDVKSVATPQRHQPETDAVSPTASTVPGTIGVTSDGYGESLRDEGVVTKALASAPKPSQSPNGLITQQPIIEPMEYPENEPFEASGLDDDDDELDLDIPDISDAFAPKPVVGAPQLSPAAIRSRAKRIFQKRADGSKKVSDEIWADWHAKGSKRRNLEDIFKGCGYDPDP